MHFWQKQLSAASSAAAPPPFPGKVNAVLRARTTGYMTAPLQTTPPPKVHDGDLVFAFTVLLINPPTGTEQIGVLGFNKPRPARRQRRWGSSSFIFGGRRICYWNFVSVGGLFLKHWVQRLFLERENNVEQSCLIGKDGIPKKNKIKKIGREKKRHSRGFNS